MTTIKNITIEMLWKEVGFKPNDNQRAAIEHMDGPLYLTAGPGSGKTRVLLWRTVNLLVFHGVGPEEVYLSTFTEKAAHQLKEGLRTLLGMVTNHTGQPYDLTPMYIGTVHSLCQLPGQAQGSDTYISITVMKVSDLQKQALKENRKLGM